MIRLTPSECRALLRETIRLAQENALAERRTLRVVGSYYLEDRPAKIEPIAHTIAGTPVYQGYNNGHRPGAHVIDATTHQEVEECDESDAESSSGDSSGDWRRILSDLV